MNTAARAVLLSLVALSLTACSDDGSDGATGDTGIEGDADAGTGGADTSADTTADAGVASGEELYFMPHDDGNAFACGSCHAIEEPAADGWRRPGHPLGDAVARPHYKNGTLNTLLAAVNTCREEWMNAPAFTEDDARWSTLEAFLASFAPAGDAEPLTFTQVDPPEQLDGGDVDAGQETFNGSCAVCHGINAVGADQAPPLVGNLLSAELIARRVRTSGRADSPTYPGLTGGIMPFWAEDRLSDDELRDVIAFVLQNDPDTNVGPGGGGGPDGENCEATHPMVGATGDFEAFAHGVGGTAMVIDDCTIEVTDFVYDGQGVNVQMYGAIGSQFESGFSMSEDLRRAGGYDGETLQFRLPEDVTLDDLDSLSVWCVPIGVSFGDAVLVNP